MLAESEQVLNETSLKDSTVNEVAKCSWGGSGNLLQDFGATLKKIKPWIPGRTAGLPGMTGWWWNSHFPIKPPGGALLWTS